MMAMGVVANRPVAVRHAVIVIPNDASRHAMGVVNPLSPNPVPGVSRDTKRDEKSRAGHDDHRVPSPDRPEKLDLPRNLDLRHLGVKQVLPHVMADRLTQNEVLSDHVATFIVPMFLVRIHLTAVVLARLMVAPNLVTAFLLMTADRRASVANPMVTVANHRVADVNHRATVVNHRASGNLAEILNAEWTQAEARVHDHPETPGQAETLGERVMRGRVIPWMLLAVVVAVPSRAAIECDSRWPGCSGFLSLSSFDSPATADDLGFAFC